MNERGGPSKEQLQALAAPFPAARIRWRPGATNREKTRAQALAYLDARDVIGRLNEVMGGDWEFRWDPLDDGSAQGYLTVAGVTRSDVGLRGDAAAGDTWKSAVSDALKRCAVHYGVGRYLYYLPDAWVDYDARARRLLSVPKLPAWAMEGARSRDGVPAVASATDDDDARDPYTAEETPPWEDEPEAGKPAQESAAGEEDESKLLPVSSYPRPWGAFTTARALRKRAARGSSLPASQEQSGLVASTVNALFSNRAEELRDRLRYAVTEYAFGVRSSKELTRGQASALISWGKGGDNGSSIADAVAEAAAIISVTDEAAGQMKLDTEGAGNEDR